MRMMLIAIAALAGASCTQPNPPESASGTPAASDQSAAGPQTADEATAQDACGASRFQNLIGTPASAIDQSTLPQGTRIITPETMVTQDFRPERLNIMTGTDGRVSSLRCF